MNRAAVKLRNSYQITYIETGDLFIKHNSMCVVETEHGLDVGRIIRIPRHLEDRELEIKGKAVRMVTSEDESHIPEIEAIEKKAFDLCREKAKAKNLEMKLVAVKCLFDRTKIIFYFVSENRIDFRELVRELAAVFRTRIEMRQIGVRDEARLVGGYGPCGKELCCVTQRDEFEPVSIKMAKEQNLNLNSLKISGMCGRLLCCLAYEFETYRELNREMPRLGIEIPVGDETFTVISTDTLQETVRLRSGDRVVTISKHDMERLMDTYCIKPEAMKKFKPEGEDAADTGERSKSGRQNNG